MWKHSKKLLVRTVTVFAPWDYYGDNMNLGMKNVLSTRKLDSNVDNTANDNFLKYQINQYTFPLTLEHLGEFSPLYRRGRLRVWGETPLL